VLLFLKAMQKYGVYFFRANISFRFFKIIFPKKYIIENQKDRIYTAFLLGNVWKAVAILHINIDDCTQ
jgi:hypothetical protein